MTTEPETTMTVRIVTLGTGYFKPGLTGRVVGAPQPRTVFLGADCVETVIPEFPILLDCANPKLAKRIRPQLCQLGRDFIFA